MNNESILKPFDRALLSIVRYGLFLVFLLPFVVVLNYLYPWVSGKIWGFQIIIEILFPIYVLLAFRRKEYRPAVNPFLYAVLGYFAVITLSMLLGDNVHRSMWSKPDRLTGMFFQYHLLAMFLMAGSVWRGVLKRVIAFTVCCAVIQAIDATLQAYAGVSGSGDRGSAWFGNPSYLGQYLVPHILLAAWLWWKDRKSAWRYLWSVSAALMFVGLFASKSRGALLGVGIAIVVGAIIGAVRGAGKMRKWCIGLLIAVAALIAAYFAADAWPPTHRILYNQRLSQQYFHETSGSRTLLLENAVKGFQARPLMGWGPENFESGYYYYYDPVTLRYSDYETRQDRPHNLIFEILDEFGILGLLAYAAVFFFGWRAALKGGDDRKMEGALLVMVTVAHLGANLFIFETPVSYMMLYIELGILAAFIAPQVEQGTDELAQGAVPAALVAAAFSIWALWYGVIGTINAAKLTAQMIISLNNQNSVSASEFNALYDQLKATSTPFLERDVRAIASNLSTSRGQYRTDDYAPILHDMAKFEVGMSDRGKNDYVHALVTATAILSLPPASRTPEDSAAVDEMVARMHRLAPNRQEVQWIDAQVHDEKGDAAGAEALDLKAVDLDPGATAPKGVYAAVLISHGKYDQAMDYLKGIWNGYMGNPDVQSAVNAAVFRILQSGQYDAMLKLYAAADARQLNTFEWTMGAALAAYGKGDIKTGDAYVAKARQLYPDKGSLIDQVVAQAKQEMQQHAPAGASSTAPGPAAAPANP